VRVELQNDRPGTQIPPCVWRPQPSKRWPPLKRWLLGSKEVEQVRNSESVCEEEFAQEAGTDLVNCLRAAAKFTKTPETL